MRWNRGGVGVAGSLWQSPGRSLGRRDRSAGPVVPETWRDRGGCLSDLTGGANDQRDARRSGFADVGCAPIGSRLACPGDRSRDRGTTREVVANLPSNRFSYAFTDVSSGFLAAARIALAAYDAVDYRVLDIEKSPESQGFAPGSFDLIIAANVLHATRDLQQTITNVRKLLADGGQLFMLEGLQPCRWMDLTFGLTEGWWRFNDSVRVDYPMASKEAWDSVLREAGFDDVAVVSPLPEADTSRSVNGNGTFEVRPQNPWNDSADAQAENVVIVASADRGKPLATGDHWVLVTDKPSRAQRIANRLVKFGCTQQTIDATQPQFAQQVTQALAEYPDVQHVAYIAGRGTGDLAAAGRLACQRLMQTVQGILLKTSGAIEFALITSHAGADPVASSLRALMRSVALEQPNWRIRGIDVDASKEDAARLATAELLSNDDDAEVSVSQIRSVRRLVDLRQQVATSAGRVLRVMQRGSLEGTKLVSVPRRTPKAREVELAVLASGLNYRDLLLAMGMYPGEAPLGAECVGRVTRIGPAASNVMPCVVRNDAFALNEANHLISDHATYKVGDIVIGLAEETFADYVNVSTDLIAAAAERDRLSQSGNDPGRLFDRLVRTQGSWTSRCLASSADSFGDRRCWDCSDSNCQGIAGGDFCNGVSTETCRASRNGNQARL
ncbi:MAG: methyltransferase [Pirellulaceae bacterium]